MAPPPSKLRVLCLHGFRTNVQVMQDQTRALRAAVGPDAEFVYLNGPLEAEGLAFPAFEEHYKHTKPFYEWIRYFIGDSTQSTEITPEEIVQMRREKSVWPMRYGGLDEALAYLRAKLQALGPFDVAIGFSQGALIMTVLSMWCLQNFNERWWKLSMCVNTSRIYAVNCKELFETPDGKEILVPFPSVHLIGKRDPIHDESRKMIAMYDSFPTSSPTGRLVLEHEDGHRFPSPKKHAELYAKLAHVMHQYRERAATEQTSRL